MIFEKTVRLFALVLLTAITLQADARGGSINLTPQSGAAGQTARGSIALEVLTQTEGVDFNGYLHNVYMAAKKRWLANMPPSVARGNKGITSVEFRILQDGTVPKEFMKMKSASGKADLDEASLAAIQGAAPFGKLPDKFSAPYFELRFTFYYNLQPSQP
jgi:TonB family protein